MADKNLDTLIAGLRNAYALEGQALTTMRTVHDRLTQYPQLKSALASHIAETERQQSMVEQSLNSLGETPSTLKEAVTRLTANLQGMAHMLAEDEVLKNLFSLYAFEHFEQASYRSLIAMAEVAGKPQVVQTCRQILSQEEKAGEILGRMIEDVTRTYLDLERTAGAKV